MKITIIIECADQVELKEHLKIVKAKLMSHVRVVESQEFDKRNYAYSQNDGGIFGYGINEVHIRNC